MSPKRDKGDILFGNYLFQMLRIRCNKAFVCSIIPLDIKKPVRVGVKICLDIGSALLLIPR